MGNTDLCIKSCDFHMWLLTYCSMKSIQKMLNCGFHTHDTQWCRFKAIELKFEFRIRNVSI